MNAPLPDDPVMHAAGPWSVKYVGVHGYCILDASGRHIATSLLYARDGGKSNASLITAAPDLLAALRGFEREISSRFGHDDDMSPPLRVVVAAARDAVAKAEGRS